MADLSPGGTGSGPAALNPEVPDPPALDEVVEDAGRQRLAAYYLYSALLAGIIRDGDLAPSRWPPRLAEPMGRLGLTEFAPRTGRGLDAQLTRRSRPSGGARTGSRDSRGSWST